MSSYNLPSVTQSLFPDHLLRLFALLCIIPCPFLDHRRIISSLPRGFLLCARVDWCDVCTEFTNLMKVDVDVDVKCHYRIFNTRNIRETIDSSAWSLVLGGFISQLISHLFGDYANINR